MSSRSILRWGITAIFAASLFACSHPSRFRSAKTLEKGESELMLGYRHSLHFPQEEGDNLLFSR